MDIRKLQRTIVDALEDVKAQDIQVFNTEALTSLFDRVIIASGSSNRQTRALAASVRDRVRGAGGEVKNPEGADSGEWVLVDCGDAVVHIMQPAIRTYYKLEDIWGGKSVHLKAGRDAAEAARKAAQAKSPATKPAAKSATTRAPAKRSAKPAASESTAARPAAKRPAAKRPAVTSAATSSTATKPPATKRPAAKAAAARPAPAGSAPAKRSANAGAATRTPAKTPTRRAAGGAAAPRRVRTKAD